MPKVTFEKLSYPALSPTTMCVQLADSTVRYPEGVVENLLAKFRNTFILADFVVLDMEGGAWDPAHTRQAILERCKCQNRCWVRESQPPYHGKNHEVQISKPEGVIPNPRG